MAYGDHPYAVPVKGEEASVASLTDDDLRDYMRRVITREHLTVSAVGDITAEELAVILDDVFGGLPAHGELREIAEAAPADGPRRQVIEMDVPQSVAQFGHSGFKRKDPDFIPGYILNYILGGGGFSSRLMVEVREKRGLAYSVYSYLYPLQKSAIYLGGVSTKNTAIAESLAVIEQDCAVWRRKDRARKN